MGLEEILTNRKSAICAKWFDLVIKTYPEETARFLKTKKNRFANPVGHILFQELESIMDGLIRGEDVDSMRPGLDNIIRIRAVQDISASQAVVFILLLKPVIRQELDREIRENRVGIGLLELESKLDDLTLLAFDIYMQCREKIYDLKANELNNRTLRLLKRARIFSEDQAEDAAQD
ncbi:MAG: RsbRD N-terminal domain-containing protein [Thermodesulfobacteriota bacterium]